MTYTTISMNDIMYINSIDRTSYIIEATNSSDVYKNLLILIDKLTSKFVLMSDKLMEKNINWIKDNSNNVGKIVQNFSYEMYPYWNGFNKLINFNLPTFDAAKEYCTDAKTFADKFFKELIDDHGTFNQARFVFRGGDKMTTVSSGVLRSKFDSMIKFLESYKTYTNTIVESNKQIKNVLNKAISEDKTKINESVSLYSLLEAVDTSKENKKETQPNLDEKAKYGIYCKICYIVNSIRMDILEETYSKYMACLTRALKTTKPPSTDETKK